MDSVRKCLTIAWGEEVGWAQLELTVMHYDSYGFSKSISQNIKIISHLLFNLSLMFFIYLELLINISVNFISFCALISGAFFHIHPGRWTLVYPWGICLVIFTVNDKFIGKDDKFSSLIPTEEHFPVSEQKILMPGGHHRGGGGGVAQHELTWFRLYSCTEISKS